MPSQTLYLTIAMTSGNIKPGDYYDDDHLYNLETSEYLCSQHINEEEIKKFIKKKGIKGTCDYCGKKVNVVKLYEVLKLIIIGIEYLYEDPGDSRYLDEDGTHGYAGDTFDFHDLWYEDKLGLQISNDKLYEDIYGYLQNDRLYCSKTEFYSEFNDLENVWEQFKDTVNHKARFVFYFKGIFKNYQIYDPFYILERLQESILKLNLITEFAENRILYRARQHKNNGDIQKASELASVPQQLAKIAGRMNPSGISMFYCSQDRNLTIMEVVDRSLTEKPYYTTGIFRNKKKLRLVDLTNIPKLSSIFDQSQNIHRETLLFLKEFVRDITKPIKSDDVIIDYIPTQIVTEYIKFNPELNVDGIIYPSSKSGHADNIVIFYDHEESLKDLTFSKRSLKTEIVK